MRGSLLGMMFVLLFITGCGGGDQVKVTEPEVALEPNQSSIKVDSTDLNILVNGNFTISVPGQSIAINDVDDVLVELLDEESHAVAMLVNENNLPLLMGPVIAAEKSVISVESTAIIFVLRQTNFWGIDISDRTELNRRITSHGSFEKLKARIITKINNGSTCPLQSDCNYVAEKIAVTIASEVEFSDLVSVNGDE